MPRLTTKRYLQVHQVLRRYWLELNTYPYSQLTVSEQWDLHRLFQPSLALSRSALLEHRERVTREDCSLPQRAGRAWRRFERAARVHRPATVHMQRSYKRRPSEDREIAIKPLLRPEVDLDKFVQALVSISAASIENELQNKVRQKGEPN